MSATWQTTVARKREAQVSAIAAHQALYPARACAPAIDGEWSDIGQGSQVGRHAHTRGAAVVNEEPSVAMVVRRLASGGETSEQLVASYIARYALCDRNYHRTNIRREADLGVGPC